MEGLPEGIPGFVAALHEFGRGGDGLCQDGVEGNAVSGSSTVAVVFRSKTQPVGGSSEGQGSSRIESGDEGNATGA